MMLTSLADYRCTVILAKDLKLLWPCALFQRPEKAEAPVELGLRAALAFETLLLFLFPITHIFLCLFWSRR